MKHTLLLVGMIGALTACDLYEPSWTTHERMKLAQKSFFQTYDVQTMTPHTVANLAEEYKNKSGEKLNITATYNPASTDSTSMTAAADVARIATLFRNNGISTLQTNVMPVADKTPTIMVSYQLLMASGPDNCNTMPGFEGNSIARDRNYALGCTVETLMARQIAHPQDLNGQKDMPALSDGRRVANSGEAYRDGVPSEPLEGLSASGDD